MQSLKQLLGPARILLALLVMALCAPAAQAQASALTFEFDYALARLVSQAVRAGQLDEQAAAAIRPLPGAAAMVRKMHLKDSDALIAYFRAQLKNPKLVAAAGPVADALARPGGGSYAQVGAAVTRQLADYVPADFAAHLKVYFIFGGNAGGFAFDDVADDVYVNLAVLAQASPEELAELVAHELFHAVQTHVMDPPPRPAPGAALAGTGPIWLNRLLYDLEQEATAELFTHRIAGRPASAYSRRGLERIARNAGRMKSVGILFETVGLRLLYAPPADEDQYDTIYGLLFYGAFDEVAYDLGWVMANAIEKKDGRPAILALLRAPPKRFFLRYQQIARADASLPRFSEEFVRAVESLAERGSL